MKRVNVNAYQVGLLFRKGAYQRMLKEGTYWLWPSETVQVYDKTKAFVAPVDLSILLNDADLVEALHVIEVKDNEIVLVYVNDILIMVLTAGRYTWWKNLVKYEFVKADISAIEIPGSAFSFGHRRIKLTNSGGLGKF